jgi:hypothetical protein
MTNQQMELSLGGAAAVGFVRYATRVPCRSRRSTRAAWWFERMRRMVECATDWTPAPAPRPEQTWLTAPGLLAASHAQGR